MAGNEKSEKIKETKRINIGPGAIKKTDIKKGGLTSDLCGGTKGGCGGEEMGSKIGKIKKGL